MFPHQSGDINVSGAGVTKKFRKWMLVQVPQHESTSHHCTMHLQVVTMLSLKNVPGSIESFQKAESGSSWPLALAPALQLDLPLLPTPDCDSLAFPLGREEPLSLVRFSSTQVPRHLKSNSWWDIAVERKVF